MAPVGVTATAPTIETARLRLRAHRVSDRAASLAMWTDPGVYRYVGGRPSTTQQAWSRLLHYAGHWALLGFGYWAVERLDTGAFVGELGFADFKRGLAAAFDEIPEIGWALVPAAHGHGFATEGLRAVVAWGDAHFTCDRTFCLIDPGNGPSLHVADKLGYRTIDRIVYLERETLVFVRSVPPGAAAAT